jgi:sugar phosphate permease
MFIITGIYVFFSVVILFTFVGSPTEIGYTLKDKEDEASEDENEEQDEGERIPFCEALKTPDVVLYGFCFFCVKFSVYSLMLWMPMFLEEAFNYEKHQIANVQTLYEVGTILGTIILGFLSDKFYSRRSPIMAIALAIAAVVSFTVTFVYTDLKPAHLSIAMFILGFCIGTTHHLICMIATADLGRQ